MGELAYGTERLKHNVRSGLGAWCVFIPSQVTEVHEPEVIGVVSFVVRFRGVELIRAVNMWLGHCRRESPEQYLLGGK